MRCFLGVVLLLAGAGSLVTAAPRKLRFVAAVGGKSTYSPGYIYTSADSGATWSQRGWSAENWVSVASSSDGQRLVAIKENYGFPEEGGIYISNNAGFSFDCIDYHEPSRHQISNSANGQVFASLAAPDSPSDRAIYLSSDRGNSWDWMGQGRNWTNGALSADGSKLVVAEWNGYVYTSQIALKSLVPRTSPGVRQWTAVTSSSSGQKLAAAAVGSNVWASEDGGNTWTEQKRSGARRWAAMAVSSNGNVLAAAADGDSIFLSKNGGKTWSATKAPKKAWIGIAGNADLSQLVAVARDDFIYVSTDAGKTWAKRGERRNWSSVASQA